MNTPTPETDAHLDDMLPADTYTCWQQTLNLARRLERERDMWKANHLNQVKLKRILMDRPRSSSRATLLVALVAERDQLRRVCDELANTTRAEFGNLNWRLDAYNQLPHVKK